MKMIHPEIVSRFLVLTVMSSACTSPQIVEEADEVRILSAHRYALMARATEELRPNNGNGARSSEESAMVSRCMGEATRQTLRVLEEAVLRGPRVVWLHLVPFAGHGGRRGFGGLTNAWYRCRFDNGQVVDIRPLPGGKYLVQGEPGFRLDLSEQAIRILEDSSAWSAPVTTQESDPRIADNEWIGRHLSFDDLVLDKSPFLKGEWEIRKIVSAVLYSIGACLCPEEETNHRCTIGLLGQAKAETIARIEAAIRQPREITLKFYPDERRELPPWQRESPSQQISCTLDNGRIVMIEHFASSNSWCVKGEEGFRLPNRHGEMAKVMTAPVD